MLISEINKNFETLRKCIILKPKDVYSKKINERNILLIGMLDSPHLHKWIYSILSEFPNKMFFIYPSDRPRLNDQKFKDFLYNNKSIKIFKLTPFNKLNFMIYYVMDLIFGIRWRAYFLARFVIRYKPAILHFHEMQHGAYIYNLIFNHRRIPINSRKIISTWGSDLTLYSSVENHKAQIETCLSWANVLTAEKSEELEDARRFGFSGEFQGPLYITLGVKNDFDAIIDLPSLRKIILVKGHQSNSGRALNALHVISQLKNELKEFEILVYSAPEAVRIQVDNLRNILGINIRTLNSLSSDQMLSYFRQARVSISLSVSDGLPGVFVEAMQFGAFPIQSENSAAKDFLINGKNGFIVNPWDLVSIRESLIKAISDDRLVDEAVKLNQEVLIEKYNHNSEIKKLRNLYL